METQGTERLGNLLEVTQLGHGPEPRSGCSPALAFGCPATPVCTPLAPSAAASGVFVPQEGGCLPHQNLRTGLCYAHPTPCMCPSVCPQQQGSEVALAETHRRKRVPGSPTLRKGEQGVGTQVQVPQGEVPEPFRTKRGAGTFLLDVYPEEPSSR